MSQAGSAALTSAAATSEQGDSAALGEAPQEVQLRRAIFLTAACGLTFAVLLLLSFWILSTIPGPRSSDADLAAFYGGAERRRLLLLGLYLMPFSGIAFMWFMVALRQWTSGTVRRENVLLSNVQLISGILFLALLFGSAAAATAAAAGAEYAAAPVDPEVARQLPLYGNTLLLVFAVRMAAVFVLTTSNIGGTKVPLRAGRMAPVLPGWLIMGGRLVGILLFLSPTFSRVLVVVFPAWVVVLCVVLLTRTTRLAADVSFPAPGPAGQAPDQAR
jgi:hypothetical protein